MPAVAVHFTKSQIDGVRQVAGRHGAAEQGNAAGGIRYSKLLLSDV